MLKGKFSYDNNDRLQFEGEMTAEDYHYLLINPIKQGISITPGVKKAAAELEKALLPQKTFLEFDKDSLPFAPEIREFVRQLPPKERTMAVVSKHYFGHILSAKNRRIYGLFYERFKRAKRQVEKEEKTGVIS